MAREYEMKRRARRQEETRRITEAAIELHQALWPRQHHHQRYSRAGARAAAHRLQEELVGS